jgi:hypothetical protein
MIFEIIVQIVGIGDEMFTFQFNVWVLGWLFQSWDLWDVNVGARLLSCMGRTFQGWGSIPLEEMSIIVHVNP